jgi:hypothetical protein
MSKSNVERCPTAKITVEHDVLQQNYPLPFCLPPQTDGPHGTLLQHTHALNRGAQAVVTRIPPAPEVTGNCANVHACGHRGGRAGTIAPALTEKHSGRRAGPLDRARTTHIKTIGVNRLDRRTRQARIRYSGLGGRGGGE